jgi:CheY-like chemotaxis protein
MDGYELARRLREIPATRDARLIAVTGYDTKANMEHFTQAGFEHYFHKPPNMEELIRVLANNKSNMAQ